VARLNCWERFAAGDLEPLRSAVSRAPDGSLAWVLSHRSVTAGIAEDLTVEPSGASTISSAASTPGRYFPLPGRDGSSRPTRLVSLSRQFPLRHSHRENRTLPKILGGPAQGPRSRRPPRRSPRRIRKAFPELPPKYRLVGETLVFDRRGNSYYDISSRGHLHALVKSALRPFEFCAETQLPWAWRHLDNEQRRKYQEMKKLLKQVTRRT